MIFGKYLHGSFQIHTFSRRHIQVKCDLLSTVGFTFAFSSSLLTPLNSLVLYKSIVRALCFHSLSLSVSLSHTHTLTHTHTHRGDTQTPAGTVSKSGGFLLLQSREQRAFRGAMCCSWPAGGDSHWDRKSRAVSRSSTSSAAVASILAREKSLMESPSTIFQVLFCGGKQREGQRSRFSFCGILSGSVWTSNMADAKLCLSGSHILIL